MAQPTWIGQTLGGRYRLEALLGQGGMSAVYKGSDPNLKREIAVKLIHSHLSSNAEFVRRFEREAEAVAKLRHPNIIQVYDFAHDGDVYYMVLEYLPGVTLQRTLEDLAARGQFMRLPEVVRIMAKVCEAAAYAHERGMVHRDLKPANVMLNLQGDPILMDFGVARMLGAAGHTATGTLIGTAYYMAPEQVQGKHPDGRADIYSLGVMLFEILAGRRPFEADSATAVMMKHLSEPVPDLRQLNPSLPAALIAVVNRALAKDPAQRFQSGTEMAQALRAADLRPAPRMAEGTVLEAPPPPPATRRIEPQPQPPLPPSPDAGAPGLSALTPPAAPARQGSRLPLLLAGGVGAVLLVVCVAAAGILGYNALNGGDVAGGATPTPAPTQAVTQAVAAALTLTAAPVAASETSAPTDTEAPAVPTATAPPTDTPAPTEPAGPYVQINDIQVEGGRYIVDYETFGYQEAVPGMHVHFFFNTVPPEQAGNPGSGPWFLWGGPRPFNGYTVADRPGVASQMCALVANPDHSIQPDTGNCYDLPS